jgi:hypothetical protein
MEYFANNRKKFEIASPFPAYRRQALLAMTFYFVRFVLAKMEDNLKVRE